MLYSIQRLFFYKSLPFSFLIYFPDTWIGIFAGSNPPEGVQPILELNYKSRFFSDLDDMGPIKFLSIYFRPEWDSNPPPSH